MDDLALEAKLLKVFREHGCGDDEFVVVRQHDKKHTPLISSPEVSPAATATTFLDDEGAVHQYAPLNHRPPPTFSAREFTAQHVVSIDPSSFYVPEVGNHDETFLGLFFEDFVQMHSVTESLSKWQVANVLSVFAIFAIVLNLLLMLGVSPKWTSWLCLLGFGTLAYMFLWFDRRLFRFTAFTFDALVPLTLNLACCVLFCTMVRFDERAVCGLHTFFTVCMIVFDDASVHNNDPVAVRRIKDEIRR